jgi:phage FluMu protein Com
MLFLKNLYAVNGLAAYRFIALDYPRCKNINFMEYKSAALFGKRILLANIGE